MTDGEAPQWTAGEPTLLITVPEAEPLVGGARAMCDASAGDGIPAHMTVLYPFLPAGRIGAGCRRRWRSCPPDMSRSG